MLSGRFLMGRGRGAMTVEQRQTIESAMSEVKALPPRHTLVVRGQAIHSSTLLLEGFMCRYMDDRDGHRQLVAVHVPGDFVDLHGFPMHRLDHDVATLGPARIGVFPHETLKRVTADDPQLTRTLWFSTLLDAAMHREWIFRLGRLGADGRVAHLLSELHARLAMVGLARDGRFELAMTQADLAEACGITGVHVNRVLRTLRERGLVTFRSGVVEIADLVALHLCAEFTPDYLYGDHAALGGPEAR